MRQAASGTGMARGAGGRARGPLAAALLLVAAGGWPAAAATGAASPPDPVAEAGLGAAARLAFDGSPEEAIAALRPLMDGPQTPEGVRARASFLLGVLLLRLGRPAEATTPLQAAAADPLLADYAFARLAQAQRAAGEPKEAARTLARLLDGHPKSPLSDGAWREMGRAAAEAGDLASAEGALQEALARAHGDAARAETKLALAEVLLRAGRPAQATPLLRELWLDLPAAREADRALEILAALGAVGPAADTAATFTEDERFRRAMRLYRGGAYAKAARELAPLAAVAGPKQAQARLALGIAHFHAREYREAIRTFEAMLAGAPGGGRAEVLFWLARGHGRLGDRARFLALLEEFVTIAPHHPRADDALFFLAGGYFTEGRRDLAAGALERLMRQHPKSDRFEAALFRRGWLWYREGQYAQAAMAFQRLAARAPGWVAQATYWKARAKEGAGRAAEAQRIYGQVAHGHDPYYRLLARGRLGAEGGPAGALRSPAAAAPAPAADRARLPVARALAGLWLADEASEEYWNLVRAHPEDRGLVAEATAALLRLQRLDRAVNLAKRVLWPQYVQSGGAPPIPAFWDALYPMGYWGLVAAEAGARRLDPHLVLAVIREESAFAPQAISPTGARGLMQLMPSTATRVAVAHRLPAPGPGRPPIEEPGYNIMLGTTELADLLGEFQGNLALALAAYNAGPHNVRRWLQERGYSGPEEFVEEIPFDETRNYVKRVLGSYDLYRALYPQPPVPGPAPKPTAQGSETPDRPR